MPNIRIVTISDNGDPMVVLYVNGIRQPESEYIVESHDVNDMDEDEIDAVMETHGINNSF